MTTTWMLRLDTILETKAKELNHFYTPFVCRMGILMKQSGIGNGTGGDMSKQASNNML